MCLEDTVRIPLRARDGSVRAYAIIDAADAPFAARWRWNLINTQYAGRWEKDATTKRSCLIYLHRELLGLPRIRDGREGDHINRDTLNNTRKNLRVLTHAQNLQNKASYRGATSRHRGVYWDSRAQRWRAEVRLNGKKHSLGSFLLENDAADAARNARIRLMPYATN